MTSDFLKEIGEKAKQRVAVSRQKISVAQLEAMPFFKRQKHDVLAAFKRDAVNVIAEIKFASPSEGEIHSVIDPVIIAKSYLMNGARMISVLTEPDYFKGDIAYLSSVRKVCPEAILLRKEFIVDPYQLVEASAYGADAALIIVAQNEREVTKDLLAAAQDLGLQSLVEVHDEAEMEVAQDLGATMIGVNNRNLKTLKIDIETSRRLIKAKQPGHVFICESGLRCKEDLDEMRALGYDGFLIGSHFMRHGDPGAVLKEMLVSVV